MGTITDQLNRKVQEHESRHGNKPKFILASDGGLMRLKKEVHSEYAGKCVCPTCKCEDKFEPKWCGIPIITVDQMVTL